MKKSILISIAVLLAISFGAFAAFAGEQMGATVTHSRDFDKMKELVGAWEGNMDMGKGMTQVKVIYDLTSAGNAIVERFAAGLPHEMITVYYDYNGRLVLTHYCSLGNQPHMELTNPGEKTMTFVLSEKAPNLVSLSEMHMHAHSLAIDSKDGITQTWTLYDKGAKINESTLKLTRMKM